MKRERSAHFFSNAILITIIGVHPFIFSASGQIRGGNINNSEKNKSTTIEKTTLEEEPENSGVRKNGPYTLSDCYNLARARNIGLKQAQNAINTNQIDRKTAQYNLLPSLSYDLGHFISFGKNIDPVTNTFVNQRFSGGSTALSLQLQLFSGFNKINTIKQSAYLIRSAEYARKSAELEVLTNITLTYARLLLGKEELSVQRNNIQSTTKELEVVKEKINVGRLSKYEFYTFNARLNTEQADLVSIQNDSLSALQDLRQLLNFPYSEKFEIAPIDTTTLSKIITANISPEKYLEDILISHPAMKQAEMDVQAAHLGEKIAKSSFYPSLSVGGNLVSNYNIGEQDTNGGKIPLKTQLNDNLGQNIYISLSIPIFSQMQNANKVKKEKINISNAELAMQDAKNTIATNTLQIINDFNGAKQKFTAILSAWEENKLSYNLYKEKYRLGQISSVELLAARDILNTSTSKYLQAKLQLFFQYQLLELLKAF
ncbi:TolC family protein [Segetibacter koreensis]|uniref:TolC family protein n=1 Tax=Segetibacter koreensis TaxID=398037 RepID=UPI00146F93C8|nr:TolC family protein [Segetibacter koreensis]